MGCCRAAALRHAAAEALAAGRGGITAVSQITGVARSTLARARLMGAKYDYYLLKDTPEGAAKEAELAGRLPEDGPFQKDIRQGFVL